MELTWGRPAGGCKSLAGQIFVSTTQKFPEAATDEHREETRGILPANAQCVGRGGMKSEPRGVALGNEPSLPRLRQELIDSPHIVEIFNPYMPEAR